MYDVPVSRLVQRIRARCGLERSRVASDAELLDAASAGLAWATALITAEQPGYYDLLLDQSSFVLQVGALVLAPDAPRIWRVRSVLYGEAGGPATTPLRIVTPEEIFDSFAMAGRVPTACAVSGLVNGDVGLLLQPRTVDAAAWSWVVFASVLPSPLAQASTVGLPSPLWEEAVVVYGAIQLLEKQELPTAQLWTHLQALEARLREVSLPRIDSGRAGVRSVRADPLSEELWRW